MTEMWQLVLLWGVVVGVGSGLTAMVLAVTVATRWFNHRRGLVMGIFAASNATGQLLLLPVIAEMATNHGWRTALLLICSVLALAGFVALLFMRERPSDVGLPLYGETAIAPPAAAGAGLLALLMSPIVALKDVARTPIFWVLSGRFSSAGPAPTA